MDLLPAVKLDRSYWIPGVFCSNVGREWQLIFMAIEKEGLQGGESDKSRGRDKQQRGLCYDEHHVWRVTVVVTLPGVLRGGVGPVGKDHASSALWRPTPRYRIARRLCRSRRCSAPKARRKAGMLLGATSTRGPGSVRDGSSVRLLLCEAWRRPTDSC